jgi:hypothetical protein
MFDTFSKDLLNVAQNHNEMSFEETVKLTCIEKWNACNNYISIPSVARNTERNLEKQNRLKNSQETNIIENIDSEKNTVISEAIMHETENKRAINDEL